MDWYGPIYNGTFKGVGMKSIYVLAVILVTAAVGCTGGSIGTTSVNSDGSCKDQFRTDYNEIRYASKSADFSKSASSQMWSLQRLQSACKTFFSHRPMDAACSRPDRCKQVAFYF